MCIYIYIKQKLLSLIKDKCSPLEIGFFFITELVVSYKRTSKSKRKYINRMITFPYEKQKCI